VRSPHFMSKCRYSSSRAHPPEPSEGPTGGSKKRRQLLKPRPPWCLGVQRTGFRCNSQRTGFRGFAVKPPGIELGVEDGGTDFYFVKMLSQRFVLERTIGASRPPWPAPIIGNHSARQRPRLDIAGQCVNGLRILRPGWNQIERPFPLQRPEFIDAARPPSAVHLSPARRRSFSAVSKPRLLAALARRACG
jgi:hypothetical protein